MYRATVRKLSARLAVGALALGGFAGAASADSIRIGDDDGYGMGVADNANLPLSFTNSIPNDARSAAEAAATDGSQQTDFYSAVFSPLPFTFDLSFAPGNITAGSLVIDMGGFQASSFGQIAVTFNGVVQAGLLNFQDGVTETQVRTFALDAATLASINAANSFTVGFDRGASNDAIAFDYFDLNFTLADNVAPVPLPAAAWGGLALLSGLGITKRLRRFRGEQAGA